MEFASEERIILRARLSLSFFPNRSLMQSNLSLSFSWLLYVCGSKESFDSLLDLIFPFFAFTRKRLTVSQDHSDSKIGFHNFPHNSSNLSETIHEASTHDQNQNKENIPES